MIALQILFWLASFLVVYSYAIYPLILFFITRKKAENPQIFTEVTEMPEVIVWMAVYNEEKVIAQKLESLLDTDFPIAKMSIWIGSDASSDNTSQIIDTYIEKYSWIRFFDFKERSGKAGVLNKMRTILLEERATIENLILIPTDANVFFEKNTLSALVKHFANPTIGQVGATILNTGLMTKGISAQEKTYIQHENRLKYYEGLLGLMQGAFGGCYAVRASLWPIIPTGFLMEDFFVSMYVFSKEKKSILTTEAICYEDVSDEVAEEFKRKTRISTGNFQNLRYYWRLLTQLDMLAFCFWSHKGLRWISPLFLLVSFVTSLSLANIVLYKMLFIVQLCLLLTTLFEKVLKSIGWNVKIVRSIAYFYQMNAALVVGFWRFLNGVKTSAWTPTKRNI